MPLDNFRTIDRETAYLLPPSVDEWLPERHLARFIVEVIDRLDLSAMSRSYRGTGSAIKRAKCLSGSHSSTDGGRRYAVSRSIVRKLSNGIPPSDQERPNQCADST